MGTISDALQFKDLRNGSLATGVVVALVVISLDLSVGRADRAQPFGSATMLLLTDE